MLKRIAAPFREFGLAAGLMYVSGRMLQALSPRLGLRVYDLVAQPVSAQAPEGPRRGQELTMRRLHPGDPEVNVMPARPEIKESRFRQGAICLGAFRGPNFIGHIWFALSGYEEDEVRCTFETLPPAQTAFDFDLYIFPEYRMGRAFMNVWNGANDFLRERGIRYTCSRIARFNTASRNAHARLGARRIGRAIFLQAWTVEFMMATIPPYLHFGVSPNSRVLLRLDTARLETQSPAGRIP
jgi:hypothetical protein